VDTKSRKCTGSGDYIDGIKYTFPCSHSRMMGLLETAHVRGTVGTVAFVVRTHYYSATHTHAVDLGDENVGVTEARAETTKHHSKG